MREIHIPDEVVEAAAVAMFQEEWGGQGPESELARSAPYWKDSARAAITAALEAWPQTEMARPERMKDKVFGNEWIWAADGCTGSFPAVIIRTEAP